MSLEKYFLPAVLSLASCSPTTTDVKPEMPLVADPPRGSFLGQGYSPSPFVETPSFPSAANTLPALRPPLPLPRLNRIACTGEISSISTGIARCCANVVGKSLCWENTGREMDQINRGNIADTDPSHSRGSPLNYDQAVATFTFLQSLDPTLTFGQYWKYLVDNIDTPRGAMRVANKIVPHPSQTDITSLLPLETIFRQNVADCDNIANVGRELLLELGRKKGFNYRPKIIGSREAKHAVLIFYDEDGIWKTSFDQLGPIPLGKSNGVYDLPSASFGFQNLGEPHLKFSERIPGPNGSILDVGSIDPETLETDGTFLRIDTNKPSYSPFDPAFFYSRTPWKNFRFTVIAFTDKIVIYRKGVLYKVTSP